MAPCAANNPFRAMLPRHKCAETRMNLYFALKLVHLLGGAVLFGTGLGIAFFLWMAHRTRDAAAIAQTARTVVIADAVFTATAVVVQPLSGAALAWYAGYSLLEPWIALSLVLYVFVGACWLPVVFIQIELQRLAACAAREGSGLPDRYRKLFRIWFCLGWPAFLGVIAIFALMIWKPILW
jgi:uncharacterized membrane protein